MVAFIATNLEADVGMNGEDFLKQPVKPDNVMCADALEEIRGPPWRAKEYETYQATEEKGEQQDVHVQSDLRESAPSDDKEELYTEADLQTVQQETVREEEGPLNLSIRATPADKAAFGNWMSYLREHGEEVLLDTNVLLPERLHVVEGQMASVEMTPDSCPTTRPKNVPLNLNTDQALAYSMVRKHLLATQSGNRPPQLRLILRGPGGTGKTVVINRDAEPSSTRAE
ncbi:hypothetical protein F5876DRAFT_82202 [Lentinula aff. lateritia]|uniref:Uncharacterized protein n=1 Tax=Lentinula aff. lateritia TaxID=2804960 RepID=A0ACC1TL32_9AGAR|nr:hypothetical protein F5876DRAFT_82202 [Lentinula aff. lateritia]